MDNEKLLGWQKDVEYKKYKRIITEGKDWNKVKKNTFLEN